MDHTHPTSTSFLTPTVSEFYNVHPANSAFDAEPDSSVCYNFPPLWCSLDVLSDDTLTAHSHLSHPIPGTHRGAAAFGHVDSQLYSADLETAAFPHPYVPCSTTSGVCQAKPNPSLSSGDHSDIELSTMSTSHALPDAGIAVKEPIVHRSTSTTAPRLLMTPFQSFVSPQPRQCINAKALQELARTHSLLPQPTHFSRSKEHLPAFAGAASPAETEARPKRPVPAMPIKTHFRPFSALRARRFADRFSPYPISPSASISSSDSAPSFLHMSEGLPNGLPSSGSSPSSSAALLSPSMVPTHPSTSTPGPSSSEQLRPQAYQQPKKQPQNDVPAAHTCAHCPPDTSHTFGRALDLERHITSIHLSSPDAWRCCGIPLSEARKRPDVPAHVLTEPPLWYEGRPMVGGCGVATSRKDVLGRHLRRNAGRCFGDENADYLIGNKIKERERARRRRGVSAGKSVQRS